MSSFTISKLRLFLLFINLFIISGVVGQSTDPVSFEIDLNDLSNDTFKVVVSTEGLGNKNNIFQFASTTPGTYQIQNIGRFVNDFGAFDKKGKEIKTERISVNQFHLDNPKKIRRIEYTVSDIWDTKVDSNHVYRMRGTSIEKDHVLINGQAVFGYFKEMQSNPINITLNYPETWQVGTALTKNSFGYYTADSYDHLADSPILLGRLSKASTNINGTSVDIYTYSKTDKIASNQILLSMEEMLYAADNFIDGLPVDRYTFLFHFEDRSAGASEHSYSSVYIWQEDDWEVLAKEVKNVAAHEFFHVVTPLNIHSEVIDVFNFETPVTSDHLWLYEGTTEWAARMMLFRSGQISLDEYLEVLQDKAEWSESHYDNSISLVELARTSYTEEGQKNYGNIYEKGALVAELLNVRLLELSKGIFGLREVIIKLSEKYGPNRPFDEKSFFKEFTNETFPEIEDFFNKYVIKADPLPYRSYFDKIGIKYIESEVSKTKSKFPYGLRLNDDKLVIHTVTEEGASNGIMKGDILISIDGEEVNMKTIYKIYGNYIDKKSGTSIQLDLQREGQNLNIESTMIEKIDLHVFVIDPNADEEQISLRKKWMRPL